MSVRMWTGGVIAAVGLLNAATAYAATLDLGNAYVTAVTPSIFRMRLGSGGFHSSFVDPAFSAGDFGVLSIDASGRQKLSTDAGAVDVDPVSHRFRLCGKGGQVLLPPSPTGWGGEGPGDLSVKLAWPDNKPFDVYASGNGSHALVQHSADAHVDNGIAVEPFFWSPAGYACFVVGSDDMRPPRCDGKIANGAVTWAVPGSSADVYLIVAPTLGDATKSLLTLTGKPPVPPKWAFGYLQSRWGWQSRAYIDDTLHQFQLRRLPVDAFIFDFEWYTAFPDYGLKPAGNLNFPDFAFNSNLFPEPAAQVSLLHDAGVHFVGIRKPRLGDRGNLNFARSQGWAVSVEKNAFYSRDFNFSNPQAAAWYAAHNEPLLKAGVDGWWDDEGERTYADYFYWNRSQRVALDAVRPHDRLWTIDRAFSPGVSRLGSAAWTGDINPDWETLRRTPADLLDWSVSGMPYAACDIGGFNGQTNAQLLTRWMEAGTFFPVMRAHSTVTA